MSKLNFGLGLGFVVAIAAGYVGVPYIVEARFADDVVAPLVSDGFSVQYGTPKMDLEQGPFGANLGDMTITKDGFTLKLTDLYVSSEGATFKSGAITDHQAEVVVTSNAGHALVNEGRFLDVYVSGLKGSEAAPLTEYLSETASGIDFTFRTNSKDDISDVMIDVSGRGAGSLRLYAEIGGVDLWNLPDEQAQEVVLKEGTFRSGHIKYTDDGAFGKLLAVVAAEEGVSAEELRSSVEIGLVGSALPSAIKEPLLAFLKKPGALSAQLSPVAGPLPFLEVAQAGAMVEAGVITPNEFLTHMGFTLVASSK